MQFTCDYNGKDGNVLNVSEFLSDVLKAEKDENNAQ